MAALAHNTNPKPVSEMTAGEINKALDRLDVKDSQLTQEFIDAGRGYERAWDILKMNDPLARRYQVLRDLRSGLRNEIERRYGPGAPSRLPKGFGPVKRNGQDKPTEWLPFASFKNTGEGEREAYTLRGKLEQAGVPVHVELEGTRNAEWVVRVPAMWQGRARKVNPMRKLKRNPETPWWADFVPGKEDHEDFDTEEAAKSAAMDLAEEGGFFVDPPRKVGKVWRVTFQHAKMRGSGKRNPESSAADMYQSFHGSPSTSTVEFEEEEHYHENLAELGVCCGVVVETVCGEEVAIGLSGYEWRGKGKEAGFVLGSGGGNKSANPQVWVWPYRRYKKNLERVSGSWGILHDIGFSGSHLYTAGEIDSNNSFYRKSDLFYKRSEALKWIKEQAKQNPKGPIESIWDKSTGTVGKVGSYLDGQLGRAINPGAILQLLRRQILYPDQELKNHEAARYVIAGTPVEVLQQTTGRRTHGKKSTRYLIRADYMGTPYFGWVDPDMLGDYESGTEMRTDKQGRRNGNPADAVSPTTTLLCSNEDGTQLFLVGGEQSIDLASLKIDGDLATKESIVVGQCLQVVYSTSKDFDHHIPTQYFHHLGEETGELPTLRYDRINERLYFDGGAYHINQPVFETSPGLEN